VQQPEITFIVGYPCPSCHVMLEARTSDSYGWLRCPSCGRASLPPEHMRTTPRERPPMAVDDEILVIGPSNGYPAMTPVARSPYTRRRPRHRRGVRRVTVASGMILSLTLLVVSVLDQNAINAMIFGIITLAIFGFLLLSPRSR
jgi:hypothetical protein